MREIFSLSDSDAWIIIFCIVILILVPYVLFLLTLQKTLQIISPENRKMPGNVWLMFIPLFNIVWPFIMVSRIADSIGDECLRLNIPVRAQRPTYNIGLTYSILSITSGFIPLIGALAAITTWVMYWTKVNEYKKIVGSQ